uniref:Malonyl-CoA:ACP transacylase (MAT) domain-containing protein n=1 Tax=Timema bartmani TaxID=61472 RepID=A0A7R9F1R6_9NEOP|nr:unnamed protein product [Timema bartmani]
MCPPEIDVACHNSSNSSTISGPEELVKTFVQELTNKNIFARAVNVANIAYHSRYIKPAAPKLLDYLKQLVTNPKPRSSKWVSSSVPESEWETPLARYSSAEYHTNNLLSLVLFEELTKFIPNNAIVIEIAPHGLLQAIMRRSFGSDCIHIPLTLRGHPNSHQFLLAAFGKLYMAGLLPKVSNLYPPVHYPVSRGTASLSSLVTWDHEYSWESLLEMDTSKMVLDFTSVEPCSVLSSWVPYLKKEKKKDDGRPPYPTLPCVRGNSTTALSLSTCETKEKERQAPYVTCERRLYYCSFSPHVQLRRKSDRPPMSCVRGNSTTALPTCATKEKERQAPYVTLQCLAVRPVPYPPPGLTKFGSHALHNVQQEHPEELRPRRPGKPDLLVVEDNRHTLNGTSLHATRVDLGPL